MSTNLAGPITSSAADLLLVRMALPSATPKKVNTDLERLLESPLSDTYLDDLRSTLILSGALTKVKRGKFALTDAGRERALQFLGVAELPPRITWSTIITKYLFSMATGLSATATAKLNNGEKLAAFVLKRKYGVAARPGATVNQVLEAIVCKELGFIEETTLDGVLRTILCRLLGTDSRLTKADLIRQLPLFETGLKQTKADEVRRKLIRDWLQGLAATSTLGERRFAEPFDLAAFASTVRVLAGRSRAENRFHDNKVFIAPLWRASQQESSFPRLSLSEFKQRLVEANGQHLLHLSRADLVPAMDTQLVADSQTSHLNATFHFVLLEQPRP